jgi:hypothetical protein
VANINDKVTIFTAAMRTEFMTAYEAAPAGGRSRPGPASSSACPRTARIEQYPWMSPPPRLKRWLGKRNYTRPDFSKYKVENLEYSAEEAVNAPRHRGRPDGRLRHPDADDGRRTWDFPGRES